MSFLSDVEYEFDPKDRVVFWHKSSGKSWEDTLLEAPLSCVLESYLSVLVHGTYHLDLFRTAVRTVAQQRLSEEDRKKLEVEAALG